MAAPGRFPVEKAEAPSARDRKAKLEEAAKAVAEGCEAARKLLKINQRPSPLTISWRDNIVGRTADGRKIRIAGFVATDDPRQVVSLSSDLVFEPDPYSPSAMSALGAHECAHRERNVKYWGSSRVDRLTINRSSLPLGVNEGVAEWVLYAQVAATNSANTQSALSKNRVAIAMEIMAPTAAQVLKWANDPHGAADVPFPPGGGYRALLDKSVPDIAARLAFRVDGVDCLALLFEHLRVIRKPPETVEQHGARLGRLLDPANTFAKQFVTEFGVAWGDAVTHFAEFVQRTANKPDERFRGTLFESYRKSLGPDMRSKALVTAFSGR